MTSPVAQPQEPVPVHILGAPDSGGGELFQQLSGKHSSIFQEAGVPLSLCRITDPDPCGPLARTVSAWSLDATHDAETMDERLKELVAALRGAIAKGGQECDIGGCPLFLVLTKCELLAEPGDTQKDWLARI